VKQLFPESFIFYEPKDIVSGDFYWFSNPGNKIIFGAIDCTGHGVPGAFMSIVGHNLLNNIINHGRVHDPATILDKLNIEISNTLKHKKGLYTIKDGMDLSMCVYYPDKMLLEYAGAFNPLYIVRDEKVLQYQADKHTIGTMAGDNIKKFNTRKIQLQKNDVIYLFTDGYADQIGGPANRKFLVRNFRELLLKISPNPMEVQKVILGDIFKDWKGESFQVDDILILGIRV
jgi:serine phosphatase RsbU (regulator of sigma subunit)